MPEGITSSEYAKRYKVTDRTARTDLAELVDKELLVRQGDYKTTRFYFRYASDISDTVLILPKFVRSSIV